MCYSVDCTYWYKISFIDKKRRIAVTFLLNFEFFIWHEWIIASFCPYLPFAVLISWFSLPTKAFLSCFKFPLDLSLYLFFFFFIFPNTQKYPLVYFQFSTNVLLILPLNFNFFFFFFWICFQVPRVNPTHQWAISKSSLVLYKINGHRNLKPT